MGGRGAYDGNEPKKTYPLGAVFEYDVDVLLILEAVVEPDHVLVHQIPVQLDLARYLAE